MKDRKRVGHERALNFRIEGTHAGVQECDCEEGRYSSSEGDRAQGSK